MSGWRLARSLDLLRAEVRTAHPGSRVDTIGDDAHSTSWSDHNPNASGVVCAADFFGNAGLDLADFADRVVAADPPALKYVIYNRKIWFPGLGWQPYRGSNPHTSHVHVSVGTGPDGRSTGPYDDETPWALWEDDMPLTDDDIQRIAQRVNGWVYPADGPALHTAARNAAADAGRAVREVAALRTEVAALADRPTLPVELDYDQLAKALLRNLAAG